MRTHRAVSDRCPWPGAAAELLEREDSGPSAPTLELEVVSALGGLRRSRHLVRGKWFKVTSLIVVGAALAIAIGPLVGFALILVAGMPFWLINLVAGVIYALTMPFVAITTVYVYFDRRVAYELGGDVVVGDLPAEIEIAR